MAHFKQFYYLTKPGIIYGNAINATAGFLLASKWHIKPVLFLATLGGISLVIASACVFNNYIDRSIDAKMARTKKRALVSGAISSRSALAYGALLWLAGFAALALYTNGLTVALGLIAFFDYVVLYGLAKRRSTLGTVVGSVAGAMPLVAGYTAVTNRFDSGAFVLFLILVFWQMPHFYAIAIRRFDDYKNAGLPVLPIIKGKRQAKWQIIFYIVAFIAANISLSLLGYTGYTYLVVMLAVGLIWLWRGLQGFKAADDTVWARRMFLFSLVVILCLDVSLSIGSVLP
ncbi:MAG TPA: heme o synthase [Candidatus Saccharimonadales bacterium]|nr:heme o synthase [Candidatus Saccharimonadales bacterium]